MELLLVAWEGSALELAGWWLAMAGLFEGLPMLALTAQVASESSAL